MYCKRWIAFAFLILAMLHVNAQQTSPQERPWESILMELMTADDIDADDWEDQYEALCDMEQEPLNINTATREQLLSLPFLNEQQVEDIHVYIYQYGAMRSLGELAMIPSIDYTTRCLLSYFVQCGEIPRPATTLGRMLQYGHHTLLASASVPMYERHGDREGYLGSRYRHDVRYQFQYSDRLRFGLLGAQDAGEPFFSGKNNMGYDYYSFYVEVHRMGKLKSLVVGRYRASWGMGLVMNNDMSLGKMASLSALGSRTYGLRAHASRHAGNYLQGAGATVTLFRGLDLSAFASYRKVDATLTHGDSAISSISNLGYHRTATEMAKKDNVSETTAGANVSWKGYGFSLGATGTFTTYSKDHYPDTSQRYRFYYPSGNDFWNASIDYGYTGHLFSVRGETATGGCHSLATINSVSFTPSSKVSVMAIYRFYGKKYYAMHAKSFGESRRVQNESGGYLGVKWMPTRQVTLQAYTDYAYFAAPTYLAQVSSHAWDNMLQAQYATDRLSITARYQFKQRECDNAEKTGLITKDTHRGRLWVTHSHGAWRLTTQGELSFTRQEQKSFGWLVAEQAGFTCRWLKLSASLGYFHTDDSESSIYAYEQGTLYGYSFASYYGEGIKYSFTARADIGSHLMVIARLSTADYFDRDHISSGYQQIDRSSKTDLQLQVRWRF